MNLLNSFLDQLDLIAGSACSDSVLRQIKNCLLDYVGVTFAGQKQLGNRLDPIVRSASPGSCAILGSNVRSDIFTAAVCNGFAAHVLEFDDGNRRGAPHLEASILTAVLAYAQKENLSLEAFARGIVAGYEATIRLSSAIQPGHKLMGFHSSGTCGTVGVAAAITYSRNDSRAQKKAAVSAAISGASGLLNVMDDGSELKPWNIVNAVSTGIIAAQIGQCGFSASDDALGGRRGFLNVFASDYRIEELTAEYHAPLIFQRYVKPYAACRHAHGAIECVLRICRDHDVRPEDITGIEIETYKLAVHGHDLSDVKSVSAAKMSIPYSVAIAVVCNACGVEEYCTQNLRDQRIRSLAEKVRVTADERLSREYPDKRGTGVTIRLSDGTAYHEAVDYPLGEPEKPLSDQLLAEKYDSLMRFSGVPDERAHRIRNAIIKLEDHYAELLRIL